LLRETSSCFFDVFQLHPKVGLYNRKYEDQGQQLVFAAVYVFVLKQSIEYIISKVITASWTCG
jgi:hypothetical protein